MVKVVTAFDRPCVLPLLCVAIGSHTPGMLPPLRLVRRAQERSRCSRDFHHGLLQEGFPYGNVTGKRELLFAAHQEPDLIDLLQVLDQ